MWLGVYGVANETLQNDRQVKSAVETVLNLGKIATSILGEIERMIGPCKRGFQIAEKCVDCAELWQFDARRASAGNGGVICGASGGDSLKARQPVTDDLSRGAQRLSSPASDGVLGEF